MCAVRMRICRYVDVVDSSVVGSHLEDFSRRWPAGLRLVVCWFCRIVVQLPTYRTCARLVTTAVEDEALRPEDGGGCAFFDSRALPLPLPLTLAPALAAYCASLVYMFIRLRMSVCILYIRTYAYIHSSHTVFSCSDARSSAPCPLLLLLPLSPLPLSLVACHWSHAAVSLAIPWFLVFLCLCLRRIPYVKYILSHAAHAPCAHRTQPEPAVLLPPAYRCRCSLVS